MNSLEATLFVVLEIILVDMAFRGYHLPKKALENKSAGIVGLLLISLAQPQKQCVHKQKAIIKLVISMLIAIFLFFLLQIMLQKSYENSTSLLIFMLAPILAMPLYYFIYSIIDIRALSAPMILSEFRIRSAASLVLGANLIFNHLNHNKTIYVISGQFILSLASLAFLLALNAHLRAKPTPFLAPLKGSYDFIDNEIMRLLVSILEIQFYVVIIYQAYCQTALEQILKRNSNYFMFFITINALIIALSLMVKLYFKPNTKRTMELLESMMIPSTFLLFGINSIISYYAEFS